AATTSTALMLWACVLLACSGDMATGRSSKPRAQTSLWKRQLISQRHCCRCRARYRDTTSLAAGARHVALTFAPTVTGDTVAMFHEPNLVTGIVLCSTGSRTRGC